MTAVEVDGAFWLVHRAVVGENLACVHYLKTSVR